MVVRGICLLKKVMTGDETGMLIAMIIVVLLLLLLLPDFVLCDSCS